MVEYFRRSMKELTEEVTWPSWAELQQTTVKVIVGSLFLGCLVALMVIIWINVLGLLY